MTRLTVTIPAATADAVNAALEALIGPDAAGTFSVHPPHPTIPDALDETVMVSSWDLAATGHEHAFDVIAQAVETHGRTGSGKTAQTADLRVGPEPATATKVTASALTDTADIKR